jgi:hypothetical protein
MRGCYAIIGVLIFAGSAAGQANLLDADPLSPAFNNPSLEQPVTDFVAIAAEKWTTSGPRRIVDIPPFGQVPIIAGAGIFLNPADVASGRITNADGLQLGYLFANSMPDALTSEVMDHAFTQILPRTLAAGEQYQLTIGFAHAGQAPPPDSVLTMSLFAFDSLNPSAEQLLASKTLTVADVNGVTLTDFFATTDPITGDAVGKQIGIRISTHTDPRPASATGQFDFDNVRLTQVPEPAGILAAAPFVAAAAMRRRQRR